jgi:hypothetical protein
MEAQAIYGSSPYIGPIVNLFHLLGMVVFMGGLLIVDFRLLGLGLKNQPLPVVARDAQPWLLGGFAVIVLSGIPQLMERATDQYVTSTFWVKMYLILIGLVFTFTVRRRVTQGDGRGIGPKLVGVVSMLIWLSVPALGRLIMMIPANTFEWLVGT